MLPNKKNDLLYLLNILEHIEKTWFYTREATDAKVLFELNDQLNFNAVLTLLANIGENAAKISEKIKRENPQVEWKQIKEFRNRVVHDYFGIDVAIIYEIIINDLKPLKEEVEKIIKAGIENKTFDPEELEISTSSKFYKHIDFSRFAGVL